MNLFNKKHYYTRKHALVEIVNSFNSESNLSIDLTSLKTAEAENILKKSHPKINLSNEFKPPYTSRPNEIAEKDIGKINSTRIYTNEELMNLCPVWLHQRMAFNRHDMDCRCKKQFPPFIYDLEYDTSLRVLPTEQLAVITVIDSEYDFNNIIKYPLFK